MTDRNELLSRALRAALASLCLGACGGSSPAPDAGSPLSPDSGTPDSGPGTASVYVVSNSLASIQAFSLDRSTGALTAVGGPLDAGTDPVAPVVSADGRFVYAADRNGAVLGYSRSADGTLTPMANSPFAAAGANPQEIALVGAHAYVADPTGSQVVIYSVDPGTGALTALTPQHTTPQPWRVVAVGDHLYFPNFNSSQLQVQGFSADPGTGALTALAGSPWTFSTSNTSVVKRPDGKALYAGGFESNSIEELPFDSAGAPVLDASATTTLTTTVYSPPVFNPSGSLAFTFDLSGNVFVLGADPATGKLSELGAPIASGVQSIDALAVESSGRFLIVAGDAVANNVGVLEIGADAGLTVAPGSPYTSGERNYGVTTY